MKSSSERMRKEEMQLTTRRIPLAMESNRLLPSVRRGKETGHYRKRSLQGCWCGSVVVQVLACMRPWVRSPGTHRKRCSHGGHHCT